MINEDEIDAKILALGNKYDILMEEWPEDIDDLEQKRLKLKKLKKDMELLIEDVSSYAEVEDFLLNGPGKTK